MTFDVGSFKIEAFICRVSVGGVLLTSQGLRVSTPPLRYSVLTVSAWKAGEEAVSYTSVFLT